MIILKERLKHKMKMKIKNGKVHRSVMQNLGLEVYVSYLQSLFSLWETRKLIHFSKLYLHDQNKGTPFPFSSGNLESFVSAEPRPIWLMVFLSEVCAQH